MDEIRNLANRKLNFFQTLKAIAWGAFGVRKSHGYDKDTATLNPVHLIIAGLLVTFLFVVGLVFAARWLTAYVS